jgi:hypothetical protein
VECVLYFLMGVTLVSAFVLSSTPCFSFLGYSNSKIMHRELNVYINTAMIDNIKY